MKKRVLNQCILGLAVFLVFAVPANAQTISAKAREIHNSAIVIDTHADTPQRFLDEDYDIGSTDPKDPGHISLDKAKAGNLGAEFFSIWVEPETNQGHFARHTLDLIDSVYEQAARHPDRMMMAFSVADIERAHREHKLAALLGIEGGHSIENDVRLLRDFYRLGVRYMTLSWSNTNEWADSSGDINNPKIEHHNGLTDGGKQIVARDEPPGHAGRYLARRRQDVLRRDRGQQSAGDRLALFRARPHESSAQHDRRHAARRRQERRRCPGEFLQRLHRRELPQGRRSPAKDRDAAVKAYTDQLKAAGKTVTYLDTDRIEREWAAKIPRPPLEFADRSHRPHRQSRRRRPRRPGLGF